MNAISPIHGIRQRIGRAVHHWQAGRRAQRHRATLLSMPDHILDDIGVNRADIIGGRSGERFLRRVG